MKMLNRIVNDEIRLNVGQLVSDLQNEGSHWGEHLAPVLFVEDLSEMPEGYTLWHEGDGEYTFSGPDGNVLGDMSGTKQDAIRAAYDDAGEDPPMTEVFEHWAVSDWLAEKLEQIGAPLARDIMGLNVWGRTETGQSLEYDSTLHAVADLIGPLRDLEDVVWFARRTRQRCVILDGFTFQIDADETYSHGDDCDGASVIGIVHPDGAVWLEGPQCARCTSTDVDKEGILQWDAMRQTWELAHNVETYQCTDCEDETWVNIELQEVNV